MYEKLNKKYLVVVSAILSVFVFFGMLFSIVPTKSVKADDGAISGQSITDNISLIGHLKAETVENGKVIKWFYSLPKDYLDMDNFTYGFVLFPKFYFEKGYIETDDYITECKDESRQYISQNYESEPSYDDQYAGYFINGSIIGMKDSNLDLVYFCCFYVQDNATNDYYYSYETSFYFSYNGTSRNNIEVDLSQFVTISNYDNVFNQLQDANARLDELENIEQENNELKKDLASANKQIKDLESSNKSNSKTWFMIACSGVLVLCVVMMPLLGIGSKKSRKKR